jgi:hypothetical protein
MRHRFTAAIAITALGAVLAAASWMPATAQPRPHLAGASTPAVATTAPEFPTFVHLPADQAAHPSAPNDWWYVVGHLNAHGHRFGYEVMIGSGQSPYALIAITDKATGVFYTQSHLYSPDRRVSPPPRSTCAPHRRHCRDRWMRCTCTPRCRPAKSI